MFGFVPHQLTAFLGGVGGDDLDALSVEVVVVEREAGALVHGGIVVDDRDRPRHLRRGRGGAFVVDHPDEIVVAHADCVSGAACGGSAGSSRGADKGSLIQRVVPRPRAESSRKRPPRRRVTILKTICKPRPVPPWLRRVVKNGSKARRWVSSLMPTPSSANSISTWSGPERLITSRIEPARRSGKACTSALRTRLVSTWP